jgi:hypothetical protein
MICPAGCSVQGHTAAAEATMVAQKNAQAIYFQCASMQFSHKSTYQWIDLFQEKSGRILPEEAQIPSPITAHQFNTQQATPAGGCLGKQ